MVARLKTQFEEKDKPARVTRVADDVGFGEASIGVLNRDRFRELFTSAGSPIVYALVVPFLCSSEASKMTKPITTGLVFSTVVFLVSTNASAGPISWTDWTAFTAGNLTGTAAGTITAGASTVNVSYAGQVGSNSVVNGVGGNTSWLPASTFSGGAVSNGPAPNRDNITLSGGTGTGVNTITFSSAVVDPVMAIWSLGAGGAPASFVFQASEPFTIQSGGPSMEFGGSSITAVGNTVNGVEGNGTIRFNGTFTQISWTNPQSEFYYVFTVGAVGASTPPIPEPSTYIMLGTGLLTIPFLIRRRAA